MATKILTADAIEGYRDYTERTIKKARYRLGSTWYEAAVTRKERMADGRVAFYIPIIPQSNTTVTVTGMELYDKDGKLWASKSESIKQERVQSSVLYRFTFDIHEEAT